MSKPKEKAERFDKVSSKSKTSRQKQEQALCQSPRQKQGALTKFQGNTAKARTSTLSKLKAKAERFDKVPRKAQGKKMAL